MKPTTRFFDFVCLMFALTFEANKQQRNMKKIVLLLFVASNLFAQREITYFVSGSMGQSTASSATNTASCASLNFGIHDRISETWSFVTQGGFSRKAGTKQTGDNLLFYSHLSIPVSMGMEHGKQDGFYFGAYGYLGIPTQLVRSKVVTYNADRTTIKKGPLYPEIGAKASIGQRFGDYAAAFEVEHGFNNLLPKSGGHLNWFSVKMSFRWFL